MNRFETRRRAIALLEAEGFTVIDTTRHQRGRLMCECQKCGYRWQQAAEPPALAIPAPGLLVWRGEPEWPAVAICLDLAEQSSMAQRLRRHGRVGVACTAEGVRDTALSIERGMQEFSGRMI